MLQNRDEFLSFLHSRRKEARVIKSIYCKRSAMENETAQCHISETLMGLTLLKFQVDT